MKIAHFLGYYPHHAGTTKAVGGMARGLARLGHETTVWTYETLRHPADEEAGVRVVTVDRGRIGGWYPSTAFRRFIASQRGEIDLVILHGMFHPLLAGLAAVLRRNAIPYVVTSHGPYHPAMLAKHRGRKVAYAPIERAALNGSIGVQVLAQRHVDDLRRFGVRAPAIVVPNGFDPADAPAPGPKPAPSTAMRVVFLGRIDTFTKGLDLLVSAMARSPREITLTLIGPDWRKSREALETRAQSLGITDRVEFRGPDYERPPVKIVAEFDLLVLPSRHEGFGFTVLEAMLAEVPVLVSTETGIADHVAAAECGWVSPPEPVALANTLTAAQRQRADWAKLGARGRAYAFENLTWDRNARIAAEAYQRLLAGR